ncbi:MAG TPA: protein kinase [Patescibacteria group bacterium]|nr:protein kinase [Patescibacteria group bacterium]
MTSAGTVESLGITRGSLAATTAGSGASSQGLRLGILPRGFILSERYEIEQPLGMGGMGMVYRARDLHLEVPVALKMIRGEFADNERILERFKKEITIARQVTHRNVTRIYDMGESEGLRYISMEYVEGQDLSHVVQEKGPVSVEKAVSILRQVCAALKEAHSVGIVHRDLKPQNVMLDANGSVHVMDFGIAMQADARGMTRTGALIGTPEYMSPEQAEGKKVDHRSDIYSLGVLMYEILTGDTPFQGGTPWEVIKKQIEERAHSIRRTHPAVPEWLDTLVLKCLEKDPTLRYQSVGEILGDIDRQEAHLSARHYLPSRRALMMGGSALGLVALAVGITLFMRPKIPVAGTGGRRSVAILPFENQTGRTDLDWLKTGLSDNLITDLGESKYFRVLSRERLNQIFQELGLTPGKALDSGTMKKMAEFGAVEAVVTGSFLSQGDQIRVNLNLQDPRTGEILKTKKLPGRESEVLGMIDALTTATKEMFELAPERLASDSDLSIASARTSSVQAASLFQKGVDLMDQGKNLEALGPLRQAVAADPAYAMAHARLAETYARIGHDREATDEIKQAMEQMTANAEKIPQTDRTFIRAWHGRINHQPEESIQAYEEMLKGDPDDPFLAFNIGEVYEETGNFAEAEKRFRGAIAHDPKNAVLRFTLGRVMIKGGKQEAALPELQQALALHKQVGSEEGQGATLNAIAYAYDLLGRDDEALDYYGRSESIKRAIGDKRGLAKTLDNKAGVLQIQGRVAEARKITEESLSLSREIGDNEVIAGTLANLGSLMEEVGDPSGMVRYYTEALGIRRTQKDRSGQATCLVGLAKGQTALGQLGQADESLLGAEQIVREIGDDEAAAEVMSDKAVLASARGALRQAQSGQQDAIAMWQKAEREDGVAEARYRLARVQMSLGQYALARESLDSALLTYTTLRDRTNQVRVTLSLAELSQATGDPKGALEGIAKVAAPLKTLDNPILLAQAGLLKTRSLSATGDGAGALVAAREACAASGRTQAVVPAIQCGLAMSLVADPDEAIAQGMTASTRASVSGLPVYGAESDLALAMAYQRAGKPDQASARARLSLDAAHRMGLQELEKAAGALARR